MLRESRRKEPAQVRRCGAGRGLTGRSGARWESVGVRAGCSPRWFTQSRRILPVRAANATPDGRKLSEELPKFKQGASPGSHTPSQLLKSPLSSRLSALFLPSRIPPAPPVECGTPGQPDLGGDGVTGFERVGARTDAGATRALEGRDRPREGRDLCAPLCSRR